MSCCGPNGILLEAASSARDDVLTNELKLASHAIGNGRWQTNLSVPSMHCASCMIAVEGALDGLDGVEHARVNLTTRRVTVHWQGAHPPPMVQTLEKAGFPAYIFDVAVEPADPVRDDLLKALAVAGFAAMNIMMMSVAVWSGAAEGSRELFHWISAALAVPALLYSGRVFFAPAWRALRQGRMSMDVPITVGVLLTFGLSVYDTINHGPYAYFDAAVSLLFFLLIGRTLDHLMRERARNAVGGLERLVPRAARHLSAAGTWEFVPVSELRQGMLIKIEPGERVPVDGRVEEGRSDVDQSIVNGEGAPRPISNGAELVAGTLNLTGSLTIRATRSAQDSFLAETIRLMDAAETSRSGYQRLADRAAGIYAPAVHLTALAALLGWFLITHDIHQAVTVAVAVLIITCPCALGLAVPMVQVMAARRLFEAGVVVRDGSGIERLAEVDTVLFDKTGTLTLGLPTLANADGIPATALKVAASLGSHSSHPYAHSLASFAGSAVVPMQRVVDYPGSGIEGWYKGRAYRLGRGSWAAGVEDAETVLASGGKVVAVFRFRDNLRPAARSAISAIQHQNCAVEIISGDKEAAVRAVATEVGIEAWQAGLLPHAKVEHIKSLQVKGHRVLMVGDGLNDAPALAAADVSMAPGDAAEMGRNAADLVFLRQDLACIPAAIAVARRSARFVKQNFVLAATYNLVAVPLAITGHVTPLIAALAMSASSISVIANSLRLSAPPSAVVSRPTGDRLVAKEARAA